MEFVPTTDEAIVQSLNSDNGTRIVLTTKRIALVSRRNDLIKTVDLELFETAEIRSPGIRKRGIVVGLIGIITGILLFWALPDGLIGYILTTVAIVAGLWIILDALWFNRRWAGIKFQGTQKGKLVTRIPSQQADDADQLIDFARGLSNDYKLSAAVSEISNTPDS